MDAFNGMTISEAEVTNISKHGFWIIVKGVEYFLPFTEFPWFRDATIAEITNLELLHDAHLYWPKLDIDLDIDIIKNLEKYPLVYKE